MKFMSIITLATLAISFPANAQSDCMLTMKLDIQGQVVEVDGADSFIDGVRTNNSVSREIQGDFHVVEIKLEKSQSPLKTDLNLQSDMKYVVTLNALTNEVRSVVYRRNQVIDYGNPIQLTSELGFKALQHTSCYYDECR